MIDALAAMQFEDFLSEGKRSLEDVLWWIDKNGACPNCRHFIYKIEDLENEIGDLECEIKEFRLRST